MSTFYQRFIHKFTKVTFNWWQALGFHVTPNHYYSPIPDTRDLPPELWTKQSELVGLNLNEAGQLKLLNELVIKYKAEYDTLPLNQTVQPTEYYINNDTYESVDGEVLYSLIRKFKPRRVWEIGSGFSTLLSAQALLKNQTEGQGGELVAFEPYPVAQLKKGFPGLTRLVKTKLQEVPMPEFQKLAANDILFIDSTHVLKIGSDVQYEYLEILPRLRSGVIIHLHDIFLPADYPREWVLKEKRFWNESYLVQAFLAFNPAFEILWAGSYLNLKYPDKLRTAFRSYQPGKTWPGSWWLRKIR